MSTTSHSTAFICPAIPPLIIYQRNPTYSTGNWEERGFTCSSTRRGVLEDGHRRTLGVGATVGSGGSSGAPLVPQPTPLPPRRRLCQVGASYVRRVLGTFSKAHFGCGRAPRLGIVPARSRAFRSRLPFLCHTPPSPSPPAVVDHESRASFLEGGLNPPHRDPYGVAGVERCLDAHRSG